MLVTNAAENPAGASPMKPRVAASMLRPLAAVLVLVSVLDPATAADSDADPEPRAEAPAPEVFTPDGQLVFTLEPAAGAGRRHAIRAPDGRRLGIVGPSGRGKDRLEVRGTDGRRIAELRRSRLSDNRYEQFDHRGRRTGHPPTFRCTACAGAHEGAVSYLTVVVSRVR